MKPTLCALISLFLATTCQVDVAGYWPPEYIEIVPQNPTSSDVVSITLGGNWPDSCIPNGSVISVTSNNIYFDVWEVYPPDTQCALVITPWELTESVDPLSSGTYSVYASLNGGSYTWMTDFIVGNSYLDINPDINEDFFVDLFDFAILGSQWLQESAGLSADIFPSGDGDEIVDTDDLVGLTAYWLNCVVGKAGNPDPGNNTKHIDPNGIFIWSAGAGAISHDVYLGTNYNDVNNATLISDEYQDNVDFNTFDPCGIDVNTAYFWRIDEVGPACTKKGDVWSFTTWLGLVAWWEFEEGGGTDANDSAATNHGTLIGDPCWVAGYVGDWALDFNGVSDYVEVSDDPSLRFSQYDSFSISFWAKPVSEGYLLSKMRASGQSDVFGYQITWSGSANRFNFSLEKSSVSTVTISTPDDSAIAGSWYFVTVVYDNKDMKIYLDGAIEDSGTFTEDTSSTTPDKALAIGARSYDSTVTSYYGGSIDDVRIYDSALTEPQIQQLYQAGTN